MVIENNKTFSNLIIPFSFPCSKGDFAKVQKKITGTKFWSREACKATYLLEPVINMIDGGKTAACFLAHREELERFDIRKNPGTRYYTAADKNSDSFRIGNIRMYIFDSGVGVVIVELNDCSDTRIPHKLRRLGGSSFSCYVSSAKEEFAKIDMSACLRDALESLLAFTGAKTFFGTGGRCGSAMIFSCHKTDREMDETAVRSLLVDQLVGSGTRDAALANFNSDHCIKPYPGAYWYVAPEGISCLLATAESSAVTNMEPRMTSDYIVAVVLALYKKLSAEKLFGGKTGTELDDKTAAQIKKFSDERTYARIADDSHKYCQKLYDLSSEVLTAGIPAAKTSADKKAGKIVISLGLVSAIIATIIGGISNMLDISDFMQYTFGVAEENSMIMSYGAVGVSVLLELLLLVLNSLRKTEE